MQQIFNLNNNIVVEEVPIPTINSNEVLVKVFYSLISTGTETSTLKQTGKFNYEKITGYLDKIKKLKQLINQEGVNSAIERVKSKIFSFNSDFDFYPLGYSCAGEVISVGNNIKNFKVGDRVACAGAGIASHADFIKVPENLTVKIPDGVKYENASFTTVGSIALQGLRRAKVLPGETVIILGLGLLGQLAVQIAKAWGLKVIGIDLIENRVKLAEEMGCDLSISANDQNLEEKVFNFSGDTGADSVIIYAATKSSEPANLAMRLCRKRGRVVVVGAVGMELKRNEMYMKELDFVMSTSYGPGRYDENYEHKGIDYPVAYVRWTENRNMQEILYLIYEHKLDISKLISNIYNIKDALKAFNLLVDSSADNIAVLLKYNEQNKIEKSSFLLNTNPVDKEKIGVAVIGIGNFATNVHLPNLHELNSMFNIIAISDRKPGQVKIVGEKFQARYVTTDYNEILKDDNIDLVVITTRHDSHSKLINDALNNGKHVFVEKPLALNWEEYNLVTKSLTTNNKMLFVGFNRRYSPFVIKVRELLKGFSGYPIFINYRINAGNIPSTSWVQDPAVGGGRLIGEVCHFIDLVNYLISDEVIKHDIINIPVNGKNIFNNDNFAITLSYNNGSVAQISYISIGNNSLEKERIEIFCGGKSFVINDFLNMQLYGFGEKNLKLKKINKGHKKEFVEIFNKLKGKPSLIPELNYDLVATKLTLEMAGRINGIL